MIDKENMRVRSIWDELELGLGAGKRFRVLVHLILNPNKAFTKYALAKATGLRTPSIEEYLEILVKLGWVKENEFKPKTYQINPENDIIKILLDFFKRMLNSQRFKAAQPPPPT